MGRLGPAGLDCRPGGRGTRRRGMLRGFPMNALFMRLQTSTAPVYILALCLAMVAAVVGIFLFGAGGGRGGGQCSAGYDAAGEECPSTCVALWRGNGYCNTEWWVVALTCKASSIQLFGFSRSFSKSAETASAALVEKCNTYRNTYCNTQCHSRQLQNRSVNALASYG